MEESAIRDGFNHLRPGHEYDNLYQSALARQKADWLVGINGTRLFTVLYNGKVLKVGRVQTPTLAMLVDRETEIMNFKKTPFYTVEITANGLTAVGDKIKDKVDAESIAISVKGKSAVVEDVRREEKRINPPKLYDLTTLQRDANRIFGFTAKQTLEVEIQDEIKTMVKGILSDDLCGIQSIRRCETLETGRRILLFSPE